MGWPVISLTHLINISHTHAFVVGIMSNLPYLHITIFQMNLGYHYPVPTQVFFLQLFWKTIIQQFKGLNGMLPHPHIQFLLHQSSSQQYSRLTRSPLYAALWITEAGFYMPNALPNAKPKVSMQWRVLKALPGKGKNYALDPMLFWSIDSWGKGQPTLYVKEAVEGEGKWGEKDSCIHLSTFLIFCSVCHRWRHSWRYSRWFAGLWL